MSVESQEAFRVELTSLIDRFAKEWDINRVEVVGMLFWVASAIVYLPDDADAACEHADRLYSSNRWWCPNCNVTGRVT